MMEVVRQDDEHCVNVTHHPPIIRLHDRVVAKQISNYLGSLFLDIDNC